MIARYLSRHIPDERPLILAGDFNDWTNALSYFFAQEMLLNDVMIKARGRPQASYPSFLPLISIDRIYYRNLIYRAARIMKVVGWKGASDHLPIVADLALSDRDPYAK
jgi:endonuclease/exonuclease/phosphatase family metal-dependent hydrolase